MYIAIDIGGTKTEIASYNKLSPDSQINSQLIDTKQDFVEAYNEMKKVIEKLSNNSVIEGIGISIATRADNDGRLHFATNIPKWEGQPLRDMFRDDLGTQVIIENDAICAIYAEAYFGKLENTHKILLLIIGTGLGGAYIEKKENYKDFVIPLEPGGLILHQNGYRHRNLTNSGYAESYIGGGSIQINTGFDLKDIDDKDKYWEEYSQNLTLVINNLSVLFSPEVIIIGGGIPKKRKFIVEKINRNLESYNEFIKHPKTILTKLEGNSSLIGTLGLFLDK